MKALEVNLLCKLTQYDLNVLNNILCYLLERARLPSPTLTCTTCAPRIIDAKLEPFIVCNGK